MVNPEPCVVHGENLILCPSCEAERMARMRARIMRKVDESAFATGDAIKWIENESFTFSREQLHSILCAELR